MSLNQYHTVYEVRCSESRSLNGKRIVIGVTSSAAIYKAIDVVRGLVKRCADVYVVMSPEAEKLVSPILFEWACGNRVICKATGMVEHISLAKMCDCMAIVPATANTICKVAEGVADTIVTLTALSFIGLGKPLIIVPAMHLNLYKAPQVKEAISKLESFGATILEPVIVNDRLRLPEVYDIVFCIESITLRGRDLKGLKVLVTAGPTREFLDPVRFLSNPSSGYMGVAIARDAYFRGAEVTLIHGPLSNIYPPPWIRRFEVTSTEEMNDRILSELKVKEYDVVILVAAPVDFRFSTTYSAKKESREGGFTVKLELTPKIAANVRKAFNGILVGFAAETVTGNKELIDRALNKMNRYGFDIIVANNVARRDIGFSSKYNEVVIITRDGEVREVPKMTKEEVARIILDYVKKLIGR